MTFDKEYAKRLWKRIWPILSIIVLLAVIFTLIIFGLKLYFILGNELLLTATPVQLALNSYNDETTKVDFELTTNNKIICHTYCEYSVTDSRNGLVSNKSKTLKPGDKIKFSVNITAPEKGSGQIVINTMYNCQNIKSLFCQSRTDLISENSLITINYGPTPQKSNSSDYARNILSEISERLLLLDLTSQKNLILMDEFEDKMKMTDIKERIMSENVQLLQINNSYQKMKYYWNNEDYSQIISDENILNLDIDNISTEQEITYNLSLDRLRTYNVLALRFIIYRDVLKEFLSNIDLHKESIFYVNESLNYFINATNNFKNPDQGSYDTINFEMPKIEEKNNITKSVLLSEYYSLIRSASFFYDSEFEKICLMKGFCQNSNIYYFDDNIKDNIDTKDYICQEYRKLNKTFIKAFNNYAITYFNFHYPKNSTINGSSVNEKNVYDFLYKEKQLQTYDNNLTLIGKSDDEQSNIFLSGFNELANTINNKSRYYNNKIDEFNNINSKSSTDNNTFCINIIKYYNSIDILSPEDFYRQEYLWDIIQSSCLKKSDISLNYFAYITTKNLSNSSIYQGQNVDNSLRYLVYRPVLYNASTDFYNKNCIDSNKEISDLSSNLKDIDINIISVNYSKIQDITPRINVTLKEHYPICCIFQECKPCCQSLDCLGKIKYPIIFVHGHAFNKDESPAFALDSFDELQASLEVEGYLNAGTVLPTSKYDDIPKNDWGRSGYPVTIKYSYYYGIYDNNGSIINVINNSESISEYAKRINDGINLILYRTGAEKVDIIAHSMGGLVARKYIADFGDKKVDKLIMIATPNNGIAGTTKNACEFLGAQKECTDMNQNSTFLVGLNKFSFNKTTTKYYDIIGIGCDTDRKDSDGVVYSENSILPYAKNLFINGTCRDFFKPLHNELLDLTVYPETFTYIKNILKE